jgi:hypothetical protein
LFTAYVGIRSSSLSWGVFFPPPLLQAFLLLVAGCVPQPLPSPAGLLWGISPPPHLRSSGCPTLFATCLFCCYCLLLRFFFLFSLGGGQTVQGAMLIWPRVVCGSTECHLADLVSASSQAIWELLSGGPEALLVSPFNVKWRCSAQAGGVEESKFCLFWVVFPLRCISSISPRFYFRRHTFCFLPLAAILESPVLFFFLDMVLLW